MLERQFLRAFFDQLEAMTPERLDEAIEQVMKVQRTCTNGSEAFQDARFMLKHLRRRRLELVMKSGDGTHS